eukprot:COSAG02_NODE_2261_length_9322_cov_152.037298_1_plen_52_part_10
MLYNSCTTLVHAATHGGTAAAHPLEAPQALVSPAQIAKSPIHTVDVKTHLSS